MMNRLGVISLFSQPIHQNLSSLHYDLVFPPSFTPPVVKFGSDLLDGDNVQVEVNSNIFETKKVGVRPVELDCFYSEGDNVESNFGLINDFLKNKEEGNSSFNSPKIPKLFP